MKLRVAAAMAILGAALLPASAHAGPRVAYYIQTFTTDKPGTSTGIDTQILYQHPDDPDAKPIALTQEVFNFPAGTEFDETAVPDCTVSDTALQMQGASACPRNTWVVGGLGTTSMTGFPGAGETLLSVNGFDQGGGRFRVVAGPDNVSSLRFVAQGHREGRTSTVDLPRTPGGPPDGQGAIRRVHNYSPPQSLGDRAYVRTPRKCPKSRVWTFELRATFSDGVVEEYTHRVPCRRPKAKKTRRR